MIELPEQVREALSGRRAMIAFAAANLVFLLLDVAIAHSAFFRSRAELIPLFVSGAGGPLALLVALLPRSAWSRGLLWIVAAAALGTGIAGLILHVGAESLMQPTLHRLVYSAPVIAPLSYAGLGVLLLAAEHARDELQRGRWVELLTGLGLFGNFALCLLDHAQNGFWAPIEWLSVAAGALGGLAFVTSAAAREERVNERLFLWIVLALMAGTGVLGAALHLRAVLASTAASLLQRVQYGAPVFAPLLYVDLAVLGAMGLLARASPSRGASVVAGFGRGQEHPGRTGA
jgi:hypothetical protein